MSVFNRYAEYYNLLYKDKNYSCEVDYIDNLIKKHAEKAHYLLDLGCGTGKHDFLLSQKGYDVTGVDFSEKMIKKANQAGYNKENKNLKIKFEIADIRNLNLKKKFDVITSLFHVISYLVENDELEQTFENVKNHLNTDGLFIFDCWYGAGVLTDLPVVKIKRLEDKNIHVTRIAEPVIHSNDNVVDVNYTVIIKDKKSGLTDEIKETHKMRYLFLPELKLLLKKFEIIAAYDWLKHDLPLLNSWNACIVAKVK